MQEIKKLKITLKTISPIRIGMSKSPLSSIDLPIVKIGEKYGIPGSSLKGALRNNLDEFFISKYREKNNEYLKPCIAAPKASKIEEKTLSGIYKIEGCRLEDKIDYICPSCYFLGAQGIRGFVTVPILFADTESTIRMHGISVDRVTKTVRQKALYSYEMITQGVIFEGIMEILIKDDISGFEFGKPRKVENLVIDKWLEDLPEFQSSEILLEIIKDSLKKINKLGGFISKGLGNVEISVDEIQGEQ